MTSCSVSRRWSMVFKDFKVASALVAVTGADGINWDLNQLGIQGSYSKLLREGGVGAGGQHIDRRPQIGIAKSKLVRAA